MGKEMGILLWLCYTDFELGFLNAFAIQKSWLTKVSVCKSGESDFCFSDKCLGWSICSIRLLKQDAFRFTLCVHSFSLSGDIYSPLPHVHILWLGYFRYVKETQCLNLLVLHCEMSLLMIYLNYHFRWGVRIIHVVLDSKFFYSISWGEN